MIKLIIAVKRNPSLTPQQFREHLSTQHARLIKACPATTRYMPKYVQNYSLPAAPGDPENAFDGCAELYFNTVEDMHRFFSDPDYLRDVRPDEDRFSDRERCVFFVTEERQVI
ncbi:EthD domain-containing protein [Duganella sp. BJB1802]|uniref:EthD domain-containing protein n=1 Tax=Duganella sp. BJB1802 TaxID=2744575 RepID=UPI001594C844|nr:EthD domain-containing protein [Duganella sp. BJB1802]NVD69595.1 EthD domain-containing protein [Duganella sp. BJB1802]